jgi:hypothetical protein
MRKERDQQQAGKKRAGKKLTIRKEAIQRLDLVSLKPAGGGGACVTHYCRSGLSCLCSSR